MVLVKQPHSTLGLLKCICSDQQFNPANKTYLSSARLARYILHVCLLSDWNRPGNGSNSSSSSLEADRYQLIPTDLRYPARQLNTDSQLKKSSTRPENVMMFFSYIPNTLKNHVSTQHLSFKIFFPLSFSFHNFFSFQDE